MPSGLGWPGRPDAGHVLVQLEMVVGPLPHARLGSRVSGGHKVERSARQKPVWRRASHKTPVARSRADGELPGIGSFVRVPRPHRVGA